MPSRSRLHRVRAGLFALLLLATGPALALAAPLAVVVHPEQPGRDISSGELERIFRAERLLWSGGEPVLLILPGSGSAAKELLLERVYRQDESQQKKYWMGLLFRNEIRELPKVIDSPELAQAVVARRAGAITVVPADEVAEGVKVLRVDGKAPGEPGYALQ